MAQQFHITQTMAARPRGSTDMRGEGPDISRVARLREHLGDSVYRTPVIRCAGLEDLLDDDTRVFGKLEFLQHTGTFKIRGALAVIDALDAAQRRAGVTAVSAGNHAIATAYAAKVYGTTAKIVMVATANPARIDACRMLGAELVMAEDAHVAFEKARDIETREGRYFVHPYDGPDIATGTGTVGLEICEQNQDFDTVIIPVGGGGLIAGMANAVRQLRPGAVILGVEPEGAASMRDSLDAGEPRAVKKVSTIADSLGAPFTMSYSFELCRQNVDDVVVVTDEELVRSMQTLFDVMKMAIEPACAASTAAMLGPLRKRLAGCKVMLTFCGSNIDWASYELIVGKGRPAC